MLIVGLISVVLITLTTVMHYEVLRYLSTALPRSSISNRVKFLTVILTVLSLHALEIAIYGMAIMILVQRFRLGSLENSDELADSDDFTLGDFLYFSAETYSSLGFGDITPDGPIRFLASMEAVHGLTLIGWSASYAAVTMERHLEEDMGEDKN